MEKIVLKWEVQNLKDSARIAAMYCFKNCEKNQN